MIDPTKITPEKLAEMNDSLIVDNNHLRGVLATVQAELVDAKAENGNALSSYMMLQQQLGSREAQIVMLRGYLADIHKTAKHYEVYWVERMVEQALAATEPKEQWK